MAGRGKSSKNAEAVTAIQRRLPNARVRRRGHSSRLTESLSEAGRPGWPAGQVVCVGWLWLIRREHVCQVCYVSATAAADTKDLGYMSRLALWGSDAPFSDFSAFASQVGKAGVAAMELVAMDMKARGLFVSRMLSFEGCSFEKLECVLSSEERRTYDHATAWWEDLLYACEKCNELVGNAGEGAPRAYWGAHQMFCKQLLNSLKCRFAIEQTEARRRPL